MTENVTDQSEAVQPLLWRRKNARAEKNWELADALWVELKQLNAAVPEDGERPDQAGREREWNSMNGWCDGCHKRMPAYPNVPSGYVSPLSDDWKIVDTYIGGVKGTEHLPKSVCRECFKIDWAIRYPGEPYKFSDEVDVKEEPTIDGNKRQDVYDI